MEQQAVKRYTAEEFFALPDDGIQREVIDGIIHIKVERIDHRPLGMTGASPAHQAIVGVYTKAHRLWLSKSYPPTTAKNDRLIKMEKYRQAGVGEYWIVDPLTQLVDIYLLFEDKYTIRVYSNEDTAVPVMVLEGCTINLAEVFAAADELEA